MKGLKVGVIVLLAVLLAAAILQNTAPVETRLLFLSFTTPKAILFTALLLVGFILGLIMGFRIGRSSRPPKPVVDETKGPADET